MGHLLNTFMPSFIAICLPNDVIIKLLSDGHSTLDRFITHELPFVIDKYKNEVTHIAVEALSKDIIPKILSWNNPDLFVVHVGIKNFTPQE